MICTPLQELARLQEHKLRLQQLQQEQAAAVERLGGAVEAVKSDVLGELAKERQQLAQVWFTVGMKPKKAKIFTAAVWLLGCCVVHIVCTAAATPV